MGAVIVDGVRIEGISACVPSRAVKNREFGIELYGDDLSGTLKVLGIEERRVCPEGSATSLDFCVKAAERLRDYAGFDYSTFGGVLFVTQTPDLLLPNNSSYAHHLLGLPPTSPAFDINLACSGYTYGLWIAGMMSKSVNAPVLLLDGDTHSHFVSSRDRAAALLFGDAGTATVVGPREGGESWYFDFVTDGTLRGALTIQDGGYRNRVNAESSVFAEQSDGAIRRAIDMKMDGMSVFSAVLKYAPNSLSRAAAASGFSMDDHDYLVLHQANLMMIKQVAKKLGFKDERFPTSLQKYGNVSSASIPLTICSELKNSVEAKRSRVLMSAFGAGFSVGSASVEIGPCPCAGVVEYEV